MSARIAAWLPDGADAALDAPLARLARTEDVAHIDLARVAAAGSGGRQ